MLSLLELQLCKFTRSYRGFGSEGYFLYMYLYIPFGLGINKKIILVCLLVSYCNLCLRIGKLPETCVQN